MPAHRLRIVLLALAGAVVAAYLTLVQTRVVDAWDPFFGHGTEKVLHSDFSRALPFPDAAAGLAAYLAEAWLGLTDTGDRWLRRPVLPIAFDVVGLGLGGAAVVLVVLQATVVGAWCTLCLCSAALSLLILGLGRLRDGREAVRRLRHRQPEAARTP